MGKILHLSDTHIDRMLGRISRFGDIQAALAEIEAVVRDTRPDVVIHSGDLFQGVRPSLEGMQLAFDFLRAVGGVAPVVVIAGNHDSGALFDLFHQVLGRESRIHLVSRIKLPSEGGVMEFPASGGGTIKVGTLPFLHANRVVGAKVFSDPQGWAPAYTQELRRLENMISAGLGSEKSDDMRILAAHFHVEGALFSGSERPVHTNEVYGLAKDSIPQVDYCAMGHIHRPQPIPGRVAGRFAGSPIQMDFGESGEEKGVVLVEKRAGKTEIQVLPLHAGRRLLQAEGTLEEIAGLRVVVRDEILSLIIKTKTPQSNLTQKVMEIFPQATLAGLEEDCQAKRLHVLERHDTQGRVASLLDLFQEFLNVEKVKNSTATSVRDEFLRTEEWHEDDTLQPAELEGLRQAITQGELQ